VNNFYVYKHLNPSDGTVFYIGKGTRVRAFNWTQRNPHHRNKLKQLLHTYSMSEIAVIIETDLDEKTAYTKEKELIQYYRTLNNGALLNICDGGEGISPKLVAGKFNVNYKHIDEKQFLKLLNDGVYNKNICKLLNVNLNILKAKFYPNTTLKEYCIHHNIPYVNTQQKLKNGNFKSFDKQKFIQLYKAGVKLTQMQTSLNLSSRSIIGKYRETFNVSSWNDLKNVIL
jgi:hypothetical protein